MESQQTHRLALAPLDFVLDFRLLDLLGAQVTSKSGTSAGTRDSAAWNREIARLDFVYGLLL
ncbi:MAG TPA: hypothetical protein VGO18_31400 [Steroidobacteraceae bacterium]|nr:hypothetical protein [Steroidobacteraceae bacterium]